MLNLPLHVNQLWRGAVLIFDPYRDINGRNIATPDIYWINMSNSGNNYFETVANAGHSLAFIVKATKSPSTFSITFTPIGRRRFLFGDTLSDAWVLFDTTLCSVINTGATASGAIVDNGDGSYTISGLISVGDTYKQFFTMQDDAIDNTTTSFVGDVTKGFTVTLANRQANLGSVPFPYTSPLGVPNTFTDRSPKRNTILNGNSGAGEDANDINIGENMVVCSTNGYIRITQNTAINNLSQFTVISALKVNSLGGGNLGRVWDKAGTTFVGPMETVITSGAGFTNRFAVYNSTSNIADWKSDTTSTFGSNVIFGLTYNGGVASDSANLWTNDTKSTPTFTPTGTPSRPSDATKNLYIGNSQSLSKNIDGSIYFTAILSRALSDGEYLCNYKYLKKLMASRGISI